MLDRGIILIASSWLNVTVLDGIEHIHVGLVVRNGGTTGSEVSSVSSSAFKALALIDVIVVTVQLFLGDFGAVSDSVEIHSLRAQWTTHVVGQIAAIHTLSAGLD